jgi:hypothetical protein
MATLTQQLPAYAYQQYSDDPDIVAFFTAYNEFSQGYLDAVNTLNLPVYLTKTGNLLNWVGSSLYGEKRQSLPVGTAKTRGPLNTYQYNTLAPNQYVVTFDGASFDVSDSQYIAIVQWNNFKGDGHQFTITWLKRRVERFLSGAILPDQTYDVSVVFTGTYTVTITIPAARPNAQALQAAIESGVVLLPFQYVFTVVLV